MVVLLETTIPSLLHSRLGTGDPRAAHCSVTLLWAFVTVTIEGGAVVITGETSKNRKSTINRPKWSKKQMLYQKEFRELTCSFKEH